MNTETVQTLAKASETVIASPVTFNIVIAPQNWLHAWLIKKKILPAKKKLEIRPIVFGNLIRISKLLLSIDSSEAKSKGNLLDISYRLVSDHADTVAEIVAIAIQNDRHEPGKKLIRLIKENLNSKEISTLLGIVLQQMELTSFISSIISIRGLNVLESEVNPESQGS